MWLQFQISAGRFEGGKKLPPVDLLSHRLGVEPETIQEAYEQVTIMDRGLATPPKWASQNLSSVASKIDKLTIS